MQIWTDVFFCSLHTPYTCGIIVCYLYVEDIQSIEYTTVSGGISDPPVAAEEAVVISGESEIYIGGPLDMPGATVEIVETEPVQITTPAQRKQPIKKKSEYREQLLLR